MRGFSERDQKRARYFSDDYSTARAGFREAVARAGGGLTALPISAKGPDPDALTIDVGWLGSAQPARAFVHSCGVHGVEAFAGSAIQCAWLGERVPRLADSDALVFIHPVNPFGMAWRRRVNASNVDLNRNCLGSGEQYAGAPDGYAALNSFLNPATAGGLDLFRWKAAWLVARFGLARLKQAIAAGQYEYPTGLFFGGRSLEEEPRVLTEFLGSRLRAARCVVGVDVHTGLGPFGVDTMLVNAPRGTSAFEAVREIFADRATPLDPTQGPAYAPKGLFETIFAQAAPVAMRLFVGQEFGTASPLDILRLLRTENREYHHRPGGVTEATRAALEAAFVPRAPGWRDRVVTRGRWAIDRVLQHLSREP